MSIDTTSMGSSLYYMVNNILPPFDDVNCRRAAALAYDYETIVRPGMAGHPGHGRHPLAVHARA